MKLKILGTGCAKCKQLLANVEQAVSELGISAEIEKVEELKEIVKYRVLATPALVMDEQVKAAGRLLSPDDIKTLLQGR